MNPMGELETNALLILTSLCTLCEFLTFLLLKNVAEYMNVNDS